MLIDGVNTLVKLRWPTLINAAASDMTFYIASALGDRWLSPAPLEGEISSSIQGSDQVRAYLYARNALIELHKRVARVVEDYPDEGGSFAVAADAYRELDASLRDNVISPPAFARTSRPVAGRAVKPDRWAAVAAYQHALEELAKDLLKRHGPKAVMQLGSTDD